MKFVIDKAQNGEFYALAYGDNNEVVWVTETYPGKASARNAISMLKTGAASAPVYDRTV